MPTAPDRRPTLVLLHALGASGASWAGVRAALGEEWRSVAPDLPGFGGHDAADTGIDTTLAWLAATIRNEVAGPYALVGHSMGGKFATLLAARRPRDLAGVVLLAGSPPAPEPMDEDRRTEMIEWFAHGEPGEAAARTFVEANIAAPLPPDAAAQAIADVRRSSPAAWVRWLERGAREDRSGEVGELDVPALIVAGAEDGDLGEANQRRLNLPHYARGRIAVVADAAHLLPYERPGAVARLIAAAAGG